jgi:hypothetical protein
MFFLSSGDPEGTIKDERVPEPKLKEGQWRICPEERETWRRYCGAWVEPRLMVVAGPHSCCVERVHTDVKNTNLGEDRIENRGKIIEKCGNDMGKKSAKLAS